MFFRIMMIVVLSAGNYDNLLGMNRDNLIVTSLSYLSDLMYTLCSITLTIELEVWLICMTSLLV